MENKETRKEPFARITIEREGDEPVVLKNVSQCAISAICWEGGIKPMDKSHIMGDPFTLTGRVSELLKRLDFLIQQGAVAEVLKQVQQQQALQQQMQDLKLSRVDRDLRKRDGLSH